METTGLTKKEYAEWFSFEICTQCHTTADLGEPCGKCGNVEPESLRTGLRYKIATSKDRDTIPIMPWFEVPRSVARKKPLASLREIGSRIIHLPIGADIVIRESRIKTLGKRHELWYRVAAPQAAGHPEKTGWINAVALIGCKIHGAL